MIKLIFENIKSNFKYTYYTLSGDEKRIIIERIREVLQKEDMELAILFSSFIELDGFRDIDTAVYFRDEIDMNKIIDLANKIDEPELYEALLMRVLDEIYLMSQD